MKRIILNTAPFSFLFIPQFVYALSINNLNLRNIADYLISLIGGALIPIGIGILFIVFFYKILMYVYSTSMGKSESFADYILWPVVGIFVLFSVWGFIYLLQLFLLST